MPKSPLLHRHLFAALAPACSGFLLPMPAATPCADHARPNILLRQRAMLDANDTHQRDADDGRQRQGRTGVSTRRRSRRRTDQPDHRAVPDGLLRMDLSGRRTDKTGSATDAEARRTSTPTAGSIRRSMASGADAFNDALGGAGGLRRRSLTAARARRHRADLRRRRRKCRVDQTAGQVAARPAVRRVPRRHECVLPRRLPHRDPGLSRARRTANPWLETFYMRS